MRFHLKFTREYVDGDAGATTLGDDAVPTTKPVADKDNILSGRHFIMQGFPIYRIAVGYKPPAGVTGKDLTVHVWLWDALSENWYRLTATAGATLKQNEIVYADLPTPGDRIVKPSQDGSDDTSERSQSYDVYVQVAALAGGGAGDNGTYTFAVAGIANQKGN